MYSANALDVIPAPSKDSPPIITAPAPSPPYWNTDAPDASPPK